MSPETFDKLFELISADMKKQDTVMRISILPKIKLTATIRFLSTGDSFADLQYKFLRAQTFACTLVELYFVERLIQQDEATLTGTFPLSLHHFYSLENAWPIPSNSMLRGYLSLLSLHFLKIKK